MVQIEKTSYYCPYCKETKGTCEICLKSGEIMESIWIKCKGGCGRLFHHKCTNEYKYLNSQQV
jgi:hypothetical protein